MSSTALRPGQTGLVVPVPEAEPLVSHWRRRFDPIAATGAGAHVTVLFPFLPSADVTATTVTRLRDRFAAQRPFEATFHRTRQFPEWLYLAPEPDTGFRALTDTVVADWPQLRPYGGVHEPIPHLSVAKTSDSQLVAEIRRDLASRAPVTTRVTTVELAAFEAGGWRQVAVFELGGANTKVNTDHAA